MMIAVAALIVGLILGLFLGMACAAVIVVNREEIRKEQELQRKREEFAEEIRREWRDK